MTMSTLRDRADCAADRAGKVCREGARLRDKAYRLSYFADVAYLRATGWSEGRWVYPDKGKGYRTRTWTHATHGELAQTCFSNNPGREDFGRWETSDQRGVSLVVFPFYSLALEPQEDADDSLGEAQLQLFDGGGQ
jgi:hypothetical protein